MKTLKVQENTKKQVENGLMRWNDHGPADRTSHRQLAPHGPSDVQTRD